MNNTEKTNIPAKTLAETGFVEADTTLFSELFDNKNLAAKLLEAMHLMSAGIWEGDISKDFPSHPGKIVIARDFLEHVSLFRLIDQPLKFGRPVILGIDGRCSAGKTTLAKIITKVYGGDFISIDDFYLPFDLRTPERMAIPGGHIHYERFIEQILKPIKAGETQLEYEKYNCFTKTSAPLTADLNSKVIVIEGSYSLHPWIRELYSLTTFLTIEDSLQKERILKRNGSERLEVFKNTWIPFEDNYRKAYDIDKYCNLLITQGNLC